MTSRFTDVRRVASTASTNADVLALGRRGEPEGIVVVAGTQTAGRGRHGRSWVAPPGSGLLCSVLLRPPARVAQLITATVAVAALDAVRSLGVERVGIKWPNDLVVVAGAGSDPNGPHGERKLAGILAEADWGVSAASADGYRSPGAHERVLVVAGIGLNVGVVADLPAEIAERRICVEELLGAPTDLAVMETRFLDALDQRYSELLGDPGGLLEAWRTWCVTLGRQVRVDLGAEDLFGRASDVDNAGRLIVTTDDGARRVVSAGDVVHLGTPVQHE